MPVGAGTSSPRTPQACRTCRRRKTKCNGVRPKCGHCSSRKIPCEWPRAYFAVNNSPSSLQVPSVAQSSSSEPVLHPEEIVSDNGLPSCSALQRCLNHFFKRHFSNDFCSFSYKPHFEDKAMAHPFLATALVSLCARYLSVHEAQHEFGKASTREVCKSTSTLARKFARESSDQPSVLNIQANLILSLSELLSDNGSSHWMYAGTAIRMAQIMRLNKEYHSRHPEQEREIRRRTFWACLQIDRLLAFTLVKPRTLSLRNVNISLPSNDICLAYGEKTRGVTLATLAIFNGNSSDISIQSYLIKSICIWSDLADFHVTQERMISKLSPTDPTSRFAQLCASLRVWTNSLPPRIQWSEENYRIHLDLNQGAAYLAIHCLLQSAWCVSHQDYLPQTDEHSILLDYMDPAGWSFLHRESTIISTCISHAMQVGKLIEAYLSSDRDVENQEQSIFLALAILSTASPLLWLRYTQDDHGSEEDKDHADAYFENYIRLFRSWRGAWDIANTWLRQLEEMRSLYRFAYMGILDDGVHTDAPSRCSSPTDQSPQSPEYRPSPGDGLPPVTISKNIYSLLRLNRTANLNLREEYQSSIWFTLMQGWPQGVDISALGMNLCRARNPLQLWSGSDMYETQDMTSKI